MYIKTDCCIMLRLEGNEKPDAEHHIKAIHHIQELNGSVTDYTSYMSDFEYNRFTSVEYPCRNYLLQYGCFRSVAEHPDFTDLNNGNELPYDSKTKWKAEHPDGLPNRNKMPYNNPTEKALIKDAYKIIGWMYAISLLLTFFCNGGWATLIFSTIFAVDLLRKRNYYNYFIENAYEGWKYR